MRIEQFEGITLIHGDSLACLSGISERVAGVVTDPPYSSGGMTRSDRMQDTATKYQSTGVEKKHRPFLGDNRDQRSWLHWMALWLGESLRVTEPGGIICMFSDWRQLPASSDALQVGGWVWRGVIPWDKINARPMANRFRSQAEYILWGTNGPRDASKDNATYLDGVLRYLPPMDRTHATQKPVELIEYLARIVKPGETILDPFMGSGTTGEACIRTGRKFIGIELDEVHFDNACRRIERALQQPPLILPESSINEQPVT